MNYHKKYIHNHIENSTKVTEICESLFHQLLDRPNKLIYYNENDFQFLIMRQMTV